MFSQQTILLLLAGMGLGYLVTINMGNSPTNNANNLDVIVKNLEAARVASSAASNSFGSADNANAGLSSPMNMMNNHREAAALLRGEATGQNHALYNHRRTSSDAEREVVEDSVAEGDSAEYKSSAKVTKSEEAASEEESVVGSAELSDAGSSAEVADVEVERRESAVRPLAINKKFEEEVVEAEEDEDASEAQKRFVETQKLIASQSIPTPTNPHVMKTVCSCLCV